ncbi:urotensin-2 receptor 2 isoform X2 [Gymnodraco acuticeps]|uniref:Urotensin-2 receptor 2 isoform X2 n=1 Tax=Gymnodraco acuticeps TaxID=8218 RepID=A0A6P8VTV1_GYMAC|nr:urotensin-2 receptor 2 isoform X2 [Gymnodraco acuticeps]
MALLRMRAPQGANATEIEKKIKRGNALRQGSAWRGFLGSRWFLVLLLVVVLMSGGALWIYLSLDSEVTETLVSRGELVSPHPRIYSVPCSEDYNNHKRYPGCTPQKCGRAVTDSIVTREEAETLKRLAERGLALAGSEGGASILDLHSGALSMGKQFVNIYRYFGEQIGEVFTEEDFQLYKDVRGRIQAVIAETFGLNPALMFLTKPTFFSRINSTIAQTQHDEYWHPHIDKDESPSSLRARRTSIGWRRFHGERGSPSRCPSPATPRTPSLTPPCPKCGYWGWGDPAERRKRDFTPAQRSISDISIFRY